MQEQSVHGNEWPGNDKIKPFNKMFMFEQFFTESDT